MTRFKLLSIISMIIAVVRVEVYFYEDQLIIHSKKNIGNYYINLDAVNELANHIAASISYFKKRETKAVGKSHLEINFNKWLQQDAQLCSDNIKRKRSKALELSRDSLPDEIHEKSRKKRGFQPLGQMVAWITDLPSPSSWEKYSSMVDNLREVVLGNLNHSNTISKTIDDITDITKKLSTDYEEVAKKSWKLEGELDSFKFYLQASHKLGIVCKEGNTLAQLLIDEASSLNKIKSKARLNLPSETLFPLDELFTMTRKLGNKHAFPLFSSENDLEELYTMSSSITTIDKNIIHAILTIPLVNFNKMFNFIDIDLSEKESEIIQNLAKLARFPIDHVLCGQSDNLKVLSTSKLNRCLKTHNAKKFFCNERDITIFRHASNRCSRLPDSIIVELSTHKILLKTTMKSMNITCNEVNKIVQIKKIYNIIKLNPNCRVDSTDFRIEEIKNNQEMKMNVEPFKVIGYHLPNPNYINAINFTENKLKMKELEMSHNILNQDQEVLNKQSKETHLLAKSLEENEINGRIVSYSFGGISIGLSVAICSIASIICLCKWRKKNGKGMELELGTHRSRNREKKQED